VAIVDLGRGVLVLKAVVAGPPAVGKTARLDQVGAAGRRERFGATPLGPTELAVLPLELAREGRPVELELYEWHGPERADVRGRGLFVGLDGLVYLADAREDRRKDTLRTLGFLADTAGKPRLQRLPGLLALGRGDEGPLRLAELAPRLPGPDWGERVEGDAAEAFVAAVRRLGAAMLARGV
jgi:hypothetical protein